MNSNLRDSLYVVNNHISVEAAANYSGYSVQYLRRLLRSGKLGGLKIGQIWLIEKKGMGYLHKKAIMGKDRRFGPKTRFLTDKG